MMNGKKDDRSDRKVAAALKYDKDNMDAPRLVASGSGKIADKIIEVAKEANVSIVEDVALVSALLALELGDEVPLELYESVARVLAFVYKVDSSNRK